MPTGFTALAPEEVGVGAFELGVAGFSSFLAWGVEEELPLLLGLTEPRGGVFLDTPFSRGEVVPFTAGLTESWPSSLLIFLGSGSGERPRYLSPALGEMLLLCLSAGVKGDLRVGRTPPVLDEEDEARPASSSWVSRAGLGQRGDGEQGYLPPNMEVRVLSSR